MEEKFESFKATYETEFENLKNQIKSLESELDNLKCNLGFPSDRVNDYIIILQSYELQNTFRIVKNRDEMIYYDDLFEEFCSYKKDILDCILRDLVQENKIEMINNKVFKLIGYYNPIDFKDDLLYKEYLYS